MSSSPVCGTVLYWRKARRVPLFTKGDPTDIDNYRGIVLCWPGCLMRGYEKKCYVDIRMATECKAGVGSNW